MFYYWHVLLYVMYDYRLLILLRVQKAPAAPHSTEQRIVTIQPADEEDGMLLLSF